MKRFLIAGLLILASLGNAAAETDLFKDVRQPGGHERGMAAKRADGRACGASAKDIIKTANFPAFKECMARRGWALDHVVRTPAERASAVAADADARPWCYGAYCDAADHDCLDDQSNWFSICSDSP